MSLSNNVLNEVERVCADGRDCSKNKSWRGRLDPVDVPIYAALHEVFHCGFKTHLKEGWTRLLHTLTIERSVVAVKSHEISNKREMSLVNCNTVDVEDCVDLLWDVGSTCFNSVPLLERVRVVWANSPQVANWVVLLKGSEVNALHEQVRLSSARLNKRTLFNSLDVANQHFLQAGFSQG